LVNLNENYQIVHICLWIVNYENHGDHGKSNWNHGNQFGVSYEFPILKYFIGECQVNMMSLPSQ